jgi:N-methylhydantoinase A
VKIGVDIGGTFTDVAVEDGPSRWSVKVPTTHAAPEDGVLEGVARGLAAAGCTLRDVSLLVHGTTLATNALIERKGARTALLTTMGFRDCLEIGNEGRFDQYDIRAIKPEPLIPRHLRFTVPERLRFDGTVVQSLNPSAVADAAKQMWRQSSKADGNFAADHL